MQEQFEKTRQLAGKYPFLDFSSELSHFSGTEG
jgi:hypothetical protein